MLWTCINSAPWKWARNPAPDISNPFGIVSLSFHFEGHDREINAKETELFIFFKCQKCLCPLLVGEVSVVPFVHSAGEEIIYTKFEFYIKIMKRTYLSQALQ